MTVTLLTLRALAHDADPGPISPEEADAVGRAIREHRSAVGAPLGHLRIELDGRAFPGIYEALADRGAPFGTAALTLEPAGDEEGDWSFLRPFDRIAFAPDGTADVHRPNGTSERAVARFRLSALYDVRRKARVPSRAAGPYPLAAFATRVRDGQLLPFGAGLDLYYADARVRYSCDLLDDALLPDPRSGHFPAAGWHPLKPRVAWELDRVLSGSVLPETAARALEILSESDGLSEAALVPILGSASGGALRTLVRHRMALFDPIDGSYRFVPGSLARGTPGRGVGDDARTDTALQAGVSELLTAADDMATCPLCGEPLSPGHRPLLCDRCQREVGGSPSTG